MTTLLRVSERQHKRIFTAIGAGFVAILLAAVLLYVTVISPSGRPAKHTIAVVFETPFVGQGVSRGTAVILHGVQVGEVTEVSRAAGSKVRLDVELQSGPTKGLTDAVGIDFRPANYFGVTGVNLIPADQGQLLSNGASISVESAGNLTLQTLLYRLGELTHDVVTPKLISVMDRATRYTDALNPLFETMIIVSTAVTDTQTVSTEQLLRNTTAISVGLPSFLDGTINAGQGYVWNAVGAHVDPDAIRANTRYLKYYNKEKLDDFNSALDDLVANPDKFAYGRLREYFVGAKFDLFSKVGDLEGSHTFDLFPLLDQTRAMANVVPRLVDPEDLADKLGELRSRLERMYQGSGDQRALQVRIMLDQLPGVEAPLGVMLGGGE
ncbi:MlaD family protein [Mycobacterium sp. pUA109]|uniref:MlaD family protein n=1 Tax=Mycobacterium sp. pUA109 TaxID=3238982 RepID=UPI00351B4816